MRKLLKEISYLESQIKSIILEGEERIMYHGTDQLFDTINTPIFFTDNLEVANSYGDVIIKANIDLQNPLVLDFESKSTKFIGEKYYMPSEIAKLIDGYNQNPTQELSDELEYAQDYMDHSVDLESYIDGVVMNNIDDSMVGDFGGVISNNVVVFDSSAIDIIPFNMKTSEELIKEFSYEYINDKIVFDIILDITTKYMNEGLDIANIKTSVEKELQSYLDSYESEDGLFTKMCEDLNLDEDEVAEDIETIMYYFDDTELFYQ